MEKREEVSRIQSFWIVNTVNVEATMEAVMAVREVPDVRITLSPSEVLDPTPDPGERG